MIYFISTETTIKIHDLLIESYGGLQGLRDYGLLLSALEMPKACFGGKDLHPTLLDTVLGNRIKFRYTSLIEYQRDMIALQRALVIKLFFVQYRAHDP